MQDTSLHSTSTRIFRQERLTVAHLFDDASRNDARSIKARFAHMPLEVAFGEAAGALEDACGALLFIASHCGDAARQRHLRRQAVALIHTAAAAQHTAALALSDADEARRHSE